MIDSSIVRRLTCATNAFERGDWDLGDAHSVREAAEIIRLCEEALETVKSIALNAEAGHLTADEGFAMIDREADTALAQIKGQNP